MSYQKQLQEHYRAVRERLRTAPSRVSVVKPWTPPPPLEECPAENTSSILRPGLLSESQEKAIVSEALVQTAAPQSIEDVKEGGEKFSSFADELAASPMLPPLEGLNLHEPGAIRWQRILHAVARQHGIKPEVIRGTSRKKEIIRARFETFYRLRVELSMSYEKIAKLMNRDHTSVLHGVTRVREQLLDAQKKTRDDKHLPAVTHPTVGRHTHL